MNMRVFSPDFVMIGNIDLTRSVQLTRRLFKPGDFSITLHPETPYADTLTYGNIIMFDRDPEKCGIVLYTEENLERGQELLTVRGKTLESLLHTRITVPPKDTGQYYEGWDRVRGSAETVMKHYVSAHCADAENTARNIPRLQIAPDLSRGDELPWQARFEYVDTVLEAIYGYSKLGYKISLDIVNKAFVFDVTEGRDLTYEGGEKARVIFSPELGNISNMVYTVSHMEYSNVGYAGGEGKDEDRLIYQVGDASGYLRRETFLDCGGANIDELIDTGSAKLAEREPQVSLEADVILKRPQDELDGVSTLITPGLGDFVTVRHKQRGLLLNTQITELTEIYERDSTTVSAVFGTHTPTVMDKIKSLGVVL